MEKYNRNGIDRLELFETFVRTGMNIPATEMSLKRTRRKRDTSTHDKGWLDRDGLLELHKNNTEVVDAIIKGKERLGRIRIAHI